MGDSDRGPFRQKSLERLSSPERLDQLLRIVDRKSWLPLSTLGILVSIGLIWSIFGKIPDNVDGRGILAHPREVVELQAPGSGYLARLDVRVGDIVEAGDVVALISRPDLEIQLELERAKARQLTALGRATEMLGLDAIGVESATGEPRGFQADGLARHVAATRSVSDKLREKELIAVRDERAMLQEQLELARKLPEALKAHVDGQRELYDSEILSSKQLIDAEESYMDSLARITDLESKLHVLTTREIEIEDRYLVRLQRIADFSLDLQDYEQEVLEVQREIAKLEQALAQEGTITSERAGRITELSAAIGRFVSPGDRLGSIALSDPESAMQAVAYFTVRDGKRLAAGMNIRITPDTVERQRHGSIEGRITDVSRLPVTLAEVETVVGNREIAATLARDGFLIQVFAELELDSGTPSGFAWSSSNGPDFSVTAGTTTTNRVAVDERPPITFVLPFLRSAVGAD